MSSERGAANGTTTAIVVHGAGDLRVETRELGLPRPDEAVIDVAFGGICGSDLHYWTHGAAGESMLREPLVLGHEVVGTVAVQAADGSGPAAGREVAVHPATPGHGAGRYPAERPNLSPGGTYLGSAAHLPHTQGAFASRVNLPTRMLRELPSGLSLREAALAEPAAVAWHGVSRAGSAAGKRALVVGCGPIGCLVVAVLKRAGAADVVAVDMLEAPLERAQSLGATRILSANDAEAIAAVEADIVVESSGHPRGLGSAIRGAARGGRVVMVGLQPSGEQPALMATAITRELELVGSFRFNEELDDVLAAMADGSLDVRSVVTHEYEAADALEAFGVAADPALSGKVLVKF